MTIPTEVRLFLSSLPTGQPHLAEANQTTTQSSTASSQPSAGPLQGLTSSYRVPSFDCSLRLDFLIAELSQYLLLKNTLELSLT